MEHLYRSKLYDPELASHIRSYALSPKQLQQKTQQLSEKLKEIEDNISLSNIFSSNNAVNLLKTTRLVLDKLHRRDTDMEYYEELTEKESNFYSKYGFATVSLEEYFNIKDSLDTLESLLL